MEDVEIFLLRPATIPLAITYFIIVDMVLEVDLGIKIPASISLETVEFIILVLMLEV